ncbi:uncharacterized protein UTRI_00876_B [Ustilago trichophora]|uniref:Uncharacterized protein n=1 Tax=Ustilago trichophora TaxID=86804 RepID=A0A5C3DTJ2_9BASI|nr:uncharacterized protein UTRI_00876_B [Ustilago trichophora]
MLGGPRVAAKVARGSLQSSSNALLRTQGASLEALLPTFLCPAIGATSSTNGARSIAGPSSSSNSNALVRKTHLHAAPPIARPTATTHTAIPAAASHRTYSSQAASAAISESANNYATSSGGQPQIWHRNQHAAHQSAVSHRDQRERSVRSSAASSDWRRKFPITRWRRDIDFNRYSEPLRRRLLPADAPALYEDEIKASAAWLPESQWTLTVPEDYPLRHELFLILDSLDDIVQSASDPDSDKMLVETLRQARDLIWLNPDHPIQRKQDRDVALYLAGKVAGTYVKLDAEDSMDRLMTFLDYVRSQIGVLPLPCFHALAAKLGITRRYDAVLKLCQVAQADHGGKADAELLHLRLRALIAQTKSIDLTRYWDLYADAGVSVPRKTFDLLLRTHVRRKDIEQVNQVLETMPQHGYEVDARAWLTILRGFQSFRPTLAAMLRRDAKIVQSPTLNVVNRMLMMLSSELDVDGALMVLRIFKIPSIRELRDGGATLEESSGPWVINGPSPQPTAQTYAILTSMFGRLGRHDEALDFFRLAISAADTADPSTVKALQQASSSVMEAFFNAGHPVLAMTFAAEMLDLPFFGVQDGKIAPTTDFKIPASPQVRIVATTVHYRILLECASAMRSVDSTRRILVHLLAEGHQIDEKVLKGLARLIFSTIDKDALESIRVIRRLIPLRATGPHDEREQRLETLSDMLQRLGTAERITIASQHSTDLYRNTRAVGSESNGAASAQDTVKLGNKDHASKDELRDWLIKDSSALFRSAALNQNANADVDGLALAKELRRRLSPEAYALRIRVYAVVRRDYESAQKVYYAMLAHRVKPTMMHIAPLIEGLTAVGKLKEAQLLKRNAKEVTGFQPTPRIHTALIRAYVRSGDSAAARAEIQELARSGYEIDDTIANIIEAAQSGRRNFALVDRPINEKDSHSVATRFHTLMRMRRYLAAQELLQNALDSGMQLDKVLHDLARRSLSYVQKEYAKASSSSSSSGKKLPHSGVSSTSSPAGVNSKVPPKAKQTRIEEEMNPSHVFELAQAVRLARINRRRLASSTHKQLVWRKQMKEHRKKVVSLILDFADGKLHQQAVASGDQ